jgi:hypothetical protein
MKKIYLILIPFIFNLTGCATIINGTTENVTVQTRNDKRPDDTNCTLENEEGTWQSGIETPVKVHRDGNDLIVNCNNEIQRGAGALAPNHDTGFVAGNLICGLFGWLLCNAIDAGTNAMYDYPSFISIRMRDAINSVTDSVDNSRQLEVETSNPDRVTNEGFIYDMAK